MMIIIIIIKIIVPQLTVINSIQCLSYLAFKKQANWVLTL